MALINFLGGIGATAEGFNDGARKQRADNKQQDVDAYEGKVRDVNTAQLPLAAEAKRLQLENEKAESENTAALNPLRQTVKMTEAKSAVDLAPGNAKAAQLKQVNDANAEAFNVSQKIHDEQMKAEVGQEQVRASMGEHINAGNAEAAIAMARHAYASPKMFPFLSDKSPPASGVIGEAPAGALDISGKPVSGKALIMKMDDGSTQYLPTSFFDAALKRKQEAATQAATIIAKPGDAGIDKRTGKVVFERDPALPKGWITNAQGDPEFLGGAYGGGGAGSGAGKGGKADVTPLSEAKKLLSDAMEKSGEKVANPQSFTKAHAHLENIFKSNPGISPGVAAGVATDAIANPSKVTLQINPKDGTVNQVYTSPDFDGGQPFNLAPNGGSLKDMETRVGKDGMKKAALDLLAGQKSEADRANLIKSAQDPATLKATLDYIQANSTPESRAANLAAFKNKVGILKSYSPGTNSQGAAPSVTLAERLANTSGPGIGSAIPREAAVRAAKAEQDKAAQATAKGATAAAQSQAKADAGAKAQAAVAGLNDEVINQMSAQEAKQMLAENDAVLSMPQRFALRVKSQKAPNPGRGITPTTLASD